MKTTRGISLIVLGALSFVVFLWFFKTIIPPKNPDWIPPAYVKASAPNAKLSQTNRPVTPQSFVVRPPDMTADEKAELAKKFTEKFKPAVKKWFDAYQGRIPFREDEFTLDKFHSRLGDYMYTFMINSDTTFTIQDSRDPKGAAKVSYLMSRKAALEMNQLPKMGFIPNITIPIKREEVIRMVKADSGAEFKPNEVIMKPSAISSALNGGAYVDILPAGKDPNNGLNYIISMVFGADGNLVNYERDPFF